jgi:hypothetical protein
MPTRRTPIKHQHSPRLKISDEMLAIYAKMRAIRCTCTPEIFPPDAGWEEWEECAHCQRWDDLNRLLLRMVGKAVPCHEFAVTTRLAAWQSSPTALPSARARLRRRWQVTRAKRRHEQAHQ